MNDPIERFGNGNGDGRDHRGRFTRGCPGGPGSPFARRIAQVRKIIMQAVSDDDLREIVGMLVKQAKKGDLAAIKEILTRLLGPPIAVDLVERLEELEHATATPAFGDETSCE